MKKTKNLHIILIIIGIIFVSLSAFHSSIWFDESYSVGIANKEFMEIWKITGNDVHPPLYYWLLHIIYLIFGSKIVMYRLLSVLGVVILGIIGYTHIRKDFGEKTGIIFTFFTYFLPIMSTYAVEIRMYSWSCLIVSLMAIYGYRFYKNVKDNKIENKNLIFFGMFSLFSCYIHYYALVMAGLVNLVLLIYLIRNRKENKEGLTKFLILAGVQILAYLPWLIFLVSQLKHVGGGFWIEVTPIKTTLELISLQYKSGTDISKVEATISTIIASIIYIYIGINLYKQKEETKIERISIFFYLGVILIMALISIFMPILYSRYLVVMTGFFIFTLSKLVAKEKNKIITAMILCVTLILATLGNVKMIKTNYDSSNMEVYNYLKQELKEGDIIIYADIVDNGGAIAVQFPEYKQYFMNFDKWDVEKAYKAFGPGMEIKTDYDFLKDYTGRIWIVYSWNSKVYDDMPKGNIKLLKEKKNISTKYHNINYNIILVDKK